MGFAQGSPEILLELGTTESLKVCLYGIALIVSHNSVLVVCINLAARALLKWHRLLLPQQELVIITP